MKKEFIPKKLNTDYLADFQAELINIDKLERTPALIKDIALQALTTAIEIQGVSTMAKNALNNQRTNLENIHEQSIAENFKVIYAQMCILAVSSLEATLKKYFENALNGFNGINLKNDELKETKITLAELAQNNLSYRGGFGSLVLEKTKLNFQDLQAIKRNFKNYLSKPIVLDSEDEKNICFYLEARHVLVHKGGFVDKKFTSATNSFNANIKGYNEKDKVEIDNSDWANIKKCFSKLVERTTKYA